MKYSKKYIFDYVNGNDIEEYNLEELEDDHNFMFEVIKLTKDKKMFEFCSERLKNDYKFIKDIILLFYSDIEFSLHLASSILKKEDLDNINYLELIILIKDMLKNTYDDEYIEYKFKPSIAYERDMLTISTIIDENKNDIALINNIERGFVVIKELYGESKIIMDYYAKMFLIELFDYEEINLEHLLHSRFKELKELKQYGIKNFLIEYIYTQDKNLSNYLATNIELLKVLDEKLKYIYKRWDKFYIENEIRRWQLINDNFNYYIEDHSLEKYFDSLDLMYHFVKKYNYEEKLFNCGMISSIEYDLIIDYCNYDEKNMGLYQLIHYNNLSKIFLNGFKLKIINDIYEDLNEKKMYKNHKCKIIELKKINKD